MNYLLYTDGIVDVFWHSGLNIMRNDSPLLLWHAFICDGCDVIICFVVGLIAMLWIFIQSGPENFLQILMHSYFATICSRITRFSPECSEKITIYQSVQNLYLTVEERLLIKTLQTEKGWIVLKNNCWVSIETVEMVYAVWSHTNNWVFLLR